MTELKKAQACSYVSRINAEGFGGSVYVWNDVYPTFATLPCTREEAIARQTRKQTPYRFHQVLQL